MLGVLADDRPAFKSKSKNHLLCVLGQVTNFCKIAVNMPATWVVVKIEKYVKHLASNKGLRK